MRPRLVVLGLLVAALLAAGTWYAWRRLSTPEPPVADLSGAESEVKAAVEAALAEVRKSPRSGKAWGRLGMVYRAHDLAAEAVQCFAEAERLEPREPRWPYLRALTLLFNDPDRALPLLRRAAELCGDEPAPRLRLAEELLRLGDLDEAEEQFRTVLGDDRGAPAGRQAALTRARAHLGLAQLAHQRGQWEESLDHLRKSAAIAPDVKATHALLAEVHTRLGNMQDAAEELRWLPSLPDGVPWPDPFVEEVEELQVRVEPRISAALHFVQQGRPERAVVHLEETVQRYPESSKAHEGLGRMLIQVGDFARAERAFREAERLAPDSAELQFLLGVALHQQRRYAGAAERYRRALGLNPRHAHAHYNLGLCLEELGDGPGAVRSLREAVRHKPDYADAHRELGRLLLDTGMADEALQHLEDAARLAPADAKVKELLQKARRP